MPVNMMNLWRYYPQGKMAKHMSELSSEVVENIFQAGIKNKQGIFKPRQWNISARDLRDAGTALAYKDMLHKKINELATKYPAELKKLRINGEEKDFIIYRGSKTEGANKGYWAQIKDTEELFLIKFGDEAQIRSEQLASDLYQLGGIKSPKQYIVSYKEQLVQKHPWDDKEVLRTGVASKWMPVNYIPEAEDAAIMREGFGMDCWLANWDAMKKGNTVMSGGDAARIDTGGSLCYRARGGRKGAAFGENVGELTSFFENYSLSKPYIKDMTRQELLDSLKRVTDIPVSKITETIDRARCLTPKATYMKNPVTGGYQVKEIMVSKGVKNSNYLKETLIARRDYILRFSEACRGLSQREGESIQDYIKRVDSYVAKKQYMLPFDKIQMSTECSGVQKGMTMAERLSPSQKKIYDDSYNAYTVSSKNKIINSVASDILTTDSMLHSTSIMNLDEILTNGVTSGDLRGAIGSGTGCATQTPLCADFWDVQKNYSIKDYFTRPRYNTGEVNFLPRIGGVSVSRGKGTMVVVVDKRKVAPTIMENSFLVSEHSSPLYKDGNMAGHIDYITHRAVPYGVPANAIDRLIIDSKAYESGEIANIKAKIIKKGLNIKLYDLQGNLL